MQLYKLLLQAASEPESLVAKASVQAAAQECNNAMICCTSMQQRNNLLDMVQTHEHCTKF